MTKQEKFTDFKPCNFVHLHIHSHYSLLDGLSKVPQLVAKIKNLDMQAVALTDHGTLSGIIEFYKECKAQGVKPIIGIEAYLASGSHLSKNKEDSKFTHLILLAYNNVGYKNLMELSTISYLKGFYYKPRIDKELLEKYSSGLIVLSGCLGGEIGEALQVNNYKKAQKIAKWYKRVFKDNFYLELQDHRSNSLQAKVNEQVLQLSKDLDIQPVITSDAHYMNKEDKEAHEVLLSIQTKRFIDDPQRMTLKEWDLFVSDPKDIVKRWQDVCPSGLVNTQKIAEKCNVDIEFDKILIPVFENSTKKDNSEYLKELVFKGLAERYLNYSKNKASNLKIADIQAKLDPQVNQRADYELGVISELKYDNYFLIVWDFCRWGKEKGIFFGPGRGSAAGSIISYSLDITTIDPLKYDLLFERFLNSQRISMPDIDIDIEDGRRDEVIEYVIDKYGSDRVANIVTFGTMAARNAVKDVARVLRMSYIQADQLAKMLPPPVFGRNVALKDSLESDEKIKNYYQSDKEVKKVFDLALRLEGTIRSHGVHAAGVVISPDKMINYCPLEINNKGIVTTQYSMNPVEDLGLLKMDFLGLSNLTTIKNALRIIRKVYKKEIDINKIGLDDKAVYKLLSQADTLGIFQLESSGVRHYLKLLKPNSFEDVAAILALYRPGPLKAGLVDDFVARKNGQQKITVPHKAFSKALKNTYGVLVYQEQVMLISRDVCGFSGMEADELRKAIGKKKRDIMKKLKDKFVEGGVNIGKVNRNIMDKFWQDIVGFADYAFNRSHSVAYGLIAYQTAYLKANYPAAYMAAVMTSSADNPDRLKAIINESNYNNISVLPPDINLSFPEFAVIKGASLSDLSIRFGMEAIKNTSSKAINQIIETRTKDGKYKNLDDFVLRQTDNPSLNRKTMESLIKAGVFDSLMDRENLLANLDGIMEALSWVARKNNTSQVSLLDTGDDDLEIDQFGFENTKGLKLDLIKKLEWEKELLGIYISQHPLDIYKEVFKKLNLKSVSELENEEKFVNGTSVKVGGLISGLKIATAKISRRKMAIIDFEDQHASKELVVFPAIFEKYEKCWLEGKILSLTLKAHNLDSQGNHLITPNWTIESASVVIS